MHEMNVLKINRWMHDGSEMAISTDGDWVDYDVVLALHRALAGETLRADKGWERAEEKIRECNELRERMARAAAADAGGLGALRMASEALEAVQRSYGIQLTSYPPQDAWLVNRVDEKVRAALAAIKCAKGDRAPAVDTSDAARYRALFEIKDFMKNPLWPVIDWMRGTRDVSKEEVDDALDFAIKDPK